MSDLISRQAAIDALQKEINKGIPPFDDTFGAIRRGVKLARDIIEDLPSVQPEQRWIPVSERLPEDSEYHLVTEYHMVSFARYWEHRWWDAFGDKAKFVTAWMPLPEPWKGDKK